jgi:AGZA family xanthine/uracil permease-like MFS transporter
VPWIANFLQVQIDNTLGAAGTSAAEVGSEAIRGAGVFYDGMVILGSGAILVGMILAAIAAYIIDKNWRAAIGYSVFGAVCSFFGIIHATELGLGQAWGPTIGYLAIGLIALGMMLYHREPVAEAEAAATPAAEAPSRARP